MKAFCVILLLVLTSATPRPGRQAAGTLGKLKKGENVTIYFSSYGCFSQTGRKMVLVNTGDGLRVSLYDGKVSYPTGGGRPSLEEGQLLKERIISAREIGIFNVFEKEVARRRGNGCTTRETYTFVSDYSTFSVTDGSCSWFGFNQLTQDLFGEVPAGGRKVIIAD